MSEIIEYYIVNWPWVYYNQDKWGSDRTCTVQEKKYNLDKNMDSFIRAVNDKCEEGWVPLGAPDIQLSSKHGATQAMTRKVGVEQAVVVDIDPVVIAEEVRPVRHSQRLISGRN